jgi:hypothetical protein
MTDNEKARQEDRIVAVLEGRLPDEALGAEDIKLLQERVDAAIAKKLADRRTVIHEGKAYSVQ